MFKYPVKCEFNNSTITAKNRQHAIEKATTLATLIGQTVTVTMFDNTKLVITPILDIETL